mgnify:CR=1 FL=1
MHFLMACACCHVCSCLAMDIYAHSILLQHVGLRGPVVLAQEQNQLYSLLSTLQKLCCCARSVAQGDWQEQIAARCCLAAGLGAVGMLQVAVAAGAGGSSAAEQQVPSLVAAAAVPSLSYLPSLVLFGRCLLQWGRQLQQ